MFAILVKKIHIISWDEKGTSYPPGKDKVYDTPNLAYGKLRAQKRFFDKDCILNFKNAKRIGRGNALAHRDFEKEVTVQNPIAKLLTTKRDTEIEWNDRTYTKKVYLGNGKDVMMVFRCSQAYFQR